MCAEHGTKMPIVAFRVRVEIIQRICLAEDPGVGELNPIGEVAMNDVERGSPIGCGPVGETPLIDLPMGFLARRLDYQRRLGADSKCRHILSSIRVGIWVRCFADGSRGYVFEGEFWSLICNLKC